MGNFGHLEIIHILLTFCCASAYPVKSIKENIGSRQANMAKIYLERKVLIRNEITDRNYDECYFAPYKSMIKKIINLCNVNDGKRYRLSLRL